MEDFNVITLKTKTGKELFLGAEENKDGFKWYFDSNKAIWFDLYKEAERFAEKYFKSCTSWKIKPLSYNIDNGKISV